MEALVCRGVMAFTTYPNALPLRVPQRTSMLGSPSRVSPRFCAAAVPPPNLRFELSDSASSPPQDGPIELPNDTMDPFSIPQVSPLQTAASVALTGAIAFFLYRSLRKRAQLSKEKRFRSSGAESVKDQAKRAALSSLNQSPRVEVPPPSVIQTLLGALLSGGIALILYKFSTTVEGGFAVKAVSSEYTIRQLTVTIRTVVVGMCYLATFVFGANSIGLTLYSLQLAFNGGQTEPPPLSGKDEANTETKPLETVWSEEVTEKE